MVSESEQIVSVFGTELVAERNEYGDLVLGARDLAAPSEGGRDLTFLVSEREARVYAESILELLPDD